MHLAHLRGIKYLRRIANPYSANDYSELFYAATSPSAYPREDAVLKVWDETHDDLQRYAHFIDETKFHGRLKDREILADLDPCTISQERLERLEQYFMIHLRADVPDPLGIRTAAIQFLRDEMLSETNIIWPGENRVIQA